MNPPHVTDAILESEHFFVRFATRAEMTAIEEIAENEEFHLGAENWTIFYDCCPAGFLLLIDKKSERIAGFATENNQFSDQLVYSHMIVVAPEFRRKNGFGLLSDAAEKLRQGRNVCFGQNRNRYLLPACKPGTKFAYKQLGYEGIPNLANLPTVDELSANTDLRVCEVTSDILPMVYAYDATLCPGYDSPSRQLFLKEWLLPGITKATQMVSFAVLRKSSDQVLGYGVGRFVDAGEWRLWPAYADNADVANLLLTTLLTAIPKGLLVFFAFPATNRAALEFCLQVGMEWEYSEVRCYVGTAPNLPIHKLYADHEFWPI